MTVLEDVKKRMMAAMKAHETVRKEILRVVVGEITTQEGRGPVSDDDALDIVRKLVKSNEQTMGLATDEAQKATLREEIDILRELLPKGMTVDEIVAALAPVREQMRAEGNDGKATGVAMRHLKTLEVRAEGKDVAAAVKRVRE